MNKNIILSSIKAEYDAVEKLFQQADVQHFMMQPNPQKWSMAQTALHLIHAVKGIAGALKDTSTLAQFGKAERVSLDYATIKFNYQKVLRELTEAGKRPYQHLTVEEPKNELLSNLHTIHQKLLERIADISEAELDSLQVPHPVLGMMTMREMLIFTAIHIKHHSDIVAKM
jgi:DinB superfamily